jgi:hypothetical protein
VKVSISEPLRINNQAGYQTVAQAKDSHTGVDIMVAQWLRFGTGGFMQMIGMAKANVWTTALTRLRAVRDGVQPK